jgi:hypothetical protein
VDLDSYYGAIAQVIPVVFVVVAFELDRAQTLRQPRTPRLVEAMANNRSIDVWSFAVGISQVVSATIGEATALRALHQGSATAQQDHVVVLCLASLAVTMVLYPFSVWLYNAGSLKWDVAMERRAQDRPAFERRRARSEQLAEFGHARKKSDDPAERAQALLAFEQAEAFLAVNLQEAELAMKESRKFQAWPIAAWLVLALASGCGLVTPLYWLLAVVAGLI